MVSIEVRRKSRYTPEGLAAYLKLSPRTIKRWLRSGRLVADLDGTISAQTVDDLLDGHCVRLWGKLQHEMADVIATIHDLEAEWALDDRIDARIRREGL